MSAIYPESEFLEQRLAQAVRRLRTERGLSRLDLSNASGLSVPAIEAIEGATVDSSLSDLDALGRALRIDPARLITGSSDLGEGSPGDR